MLDSSLKKDYKQEIIVEQIAYCLSELKLINEAVKFCKKFAEIYPKNKIILSYYRRNLFRNGKFEEGLAVYQKETGVIELDDGYLICGGLNRNSALIKLDKQTGSTIFSQTFNNGGTDAFEHAVRTPNGIVAVGYVNAQDSNNTFYTEGQGYIMFLDENANEISSMNQNSFISQAYRVQYVNDELIISGLSEEAFDFKLIKMTLDGDVLWHQSYGGNDYDHCFGMDVGNDGSIFLAGHTLSGTQNWDTYTIKLDNDGNMIWEQKVGNPRGFNPQYIHDEAWGVKATNDGGCVTIAGTGDEYNYSECNGNDCSDTWKAYLVKFSNDGSIDWESTFGSLDVFNFAYDWAGEDIDLTDDGGAIIAIDSGLCRMLFWRLILRYQMPTIIQQI